MSENPRKLTPKTEFRAAKKEEIPQIIDLFSDAFKNDPLMYIFNPKGKNQKMFIRNLFCVNTRSYFRRHLCFVTIIEKEIVAAVLVKKKNVSEINFLDYAISGGWKLIANLGLTRFIKFLSIYDTAQIDCKQLSQNAWYIDTLAVRVNRQGEGIGEEFIQQCILPYIKKNGGGLLTLITQNANNYDFYVKNGFINFSNKTLINDGVEIQNYSFSQLITTNNSNE
ncbi:hypothetical protein IGI37_002342 [Enterococcus sp. AZ194]|uniref:GNAT family N-acetyltransferase n=1 Tax=Enterococcus sp. AZ194 TaxID=2774629 RepID=UPI003F290DA7